MLEESMIHVQDPTLLGVDINLQKDTDIEPVEVFTENDADVKAGPVEGDRASESTPDVMPQEHNLLEDILSTVTEKPTAPHLIPVSDPPTPRHSVAEMPSLPATPPQTPPILTENQHSILSSPPKDIEYEPMQVEETTAQEIIPEEMTTENVNTEKTAAQERNTPEVHPDDTVMGEAIPEEVDPGNMFTEEAIPEDMVTEEVAPFETIPEDIYSGDAAPEGMIIEESALAEMVTAETTPAASSDAMEIDQDDMNAAPESEMQVDQGNGVFSTVQSLPASWYSKPLQHKGTKRFIVTDHYSEQCCHDKRRFGDRGNPQAIYPRDISFDRFQAEVRLFPPIRLQLMLQDYVVARMQELDLGPARMERHYLERLVRKSEQNDRDYTFDTRWRTYAASRPHGQREPPFTLDEALTLVTSCLAATLPNDDWLVRRAEHDFREELLNEVIHRHRELKEMSWSSSWVCPRRNSPHLAEDPTGQLQSFSRDYARQFLYYIIDKENLRSSYFREGGGTNAKHWIDGVRRRSDFISIRDPQTPWCLRRENNFQLLATWAHNDTKNCREFMQFTNVWFGECIASGTPSEAAKIKFRRFDKDRCDWLRSYAGSFPQKK